jgi:hypothetical protein
MLSNGNLTCILTEAWNVVELIGEALGLRFEDWLLASWDGPSGISDMMSSGPLLNMS